MPELVEVEAYRRLAEAALGRAIASVDAPDAYFLKTVGSSELRAALVGRSLVAAGRVGKVLLLAIGPPASPELLASLAMPGLSDMSDGGEVLGLRFGMTGRLFVDGSTGVERLLYSSGHDDPAWRRFGLRFADGGSLHISDPRRLGGVALAPDVSDLGPDARTVTRSEVANALVCSTVAIKARLLDQRRIAGIGNLLADEMLWRAGISPLVPAGSLRGTRLARLRESIVGTVEQLIERGGSHLGDLQAHRLCGGRCPKDGAALRHAVVGGRSTWWCPRHQR